MKQTEELSVLIFPLLELMYDICYRLADVGVQVVVSYRLLGCRAAQYANIEKGAEHGNGVGSRSVTSTPAAAPSVFTEEQMAQLQAAHELAIKQAVDQAANRMQQEVVQRDARIQFLEHVVTAQAASNIPGFVGRAEEHAAVKMELGKLPCLAAGGKNCQRSRLKFKAHIANTSEQAYEELERLEDPGGLAKTMTSMSDGMRALARKIHFGLTMLT